MTLPNNSLKTTSVLTPYSGPVKHTDWPKTIAKHSAATTAVDGDYPESEAAKYARGRLALPEMLQQFEAEANSIDTE